MPSKSNQLVSNFGLMMKNKDKGYMIKYKRDKCFKITDNFWKKP